MGVLCPPMHKRLKFFRCTTGPLKNHRQQKEEPSEGVGRGTGRTKTKAWRKVGLYEGTQRTFVSWFSGELPYFLEKKPGFECKPGIVVYIPIESDWSALSARYIGPTVISVRHGMICIWSYPYFGFLISDCWSAPIINLLTNVLIMVALWNRETIYIFILFLSFFFFLA